MPEAKFNWISSPIGVFPEGFRIWSIAKRAQVHALLQGLQPQMVQWVRQNAKWEDRTGLARARFRVRIQQSRLTHEVTFEHGVYYGLYLETHNAGRFGIINHALDYWGPFVMQAVQRIFY